MNISAHIESILFWKGESYTIKKLASMLNVSLDEIHTGINELEQTLTNRGIVLVRKDDEVMLRTSPETSTLIETLTKEELMKDLGKAGLETLSIIIYRGPVRRSDIDYVRGVSSSFILRNLLIRDLVEKVEIKEEKYKGPIYRPTMKLLSYLGVTKVEDLPNYERVREELDAFRKSSEVDSSNNSSNP